MINLFVWLYWLDMTLSHVNSCYRSSRSSISVWLLLLMTKIGSWAVTVSHKWLWWVAPIVPSLQSWSLLGLNWPVSVLPSHKFGSAFCVQLPIMTVLFHDDLLVVGVARNRCCSPPWYIPLFLWWLMLSVAFCLIPVLKPFMFTAYWGWWIFR